MASWLLLCRFLILLTSSGKSSAAGTTFLTVLAVDYPRSQAGHRPAFRHYILIKCGLCLEGHNLVCSRVGEGG